MEREFSVHNGLPNTAEISKQDHILKTTLKIHIGTVRPHATQTMS